MNSTYLYCATGKNYQLEAIKSAESIKKFDATNDIIIYIDKRYPDLDYESVFNKILFLEHYSYSYIDKLNAMKLCDYNKIIYLDTDTHILADISDLFLLLDRFDIGVAHEPVRFIHKYEKKEIPDSFPHLNTGVIAFKKSTTSDFIQNWIKNYDTTTHQQDQPSFRETLYYSDLKFNILPPEYNFRSNTIQFACNQIKIIHDHQLLALKNPKFNKIMERFNKNIEPRAWFPFSTKMESMSDLLTIKIKKFLKKRMRFVHDFLSKHFNREVRIKLK
jgi:alpha-N-acetylglucosamine transferase